ncbi:hypothetical protein [Pseudomonas sp. N040]|uniref:hypothetical protein n=1 Tax=Pseudomonas sp. N040 TaxID=2785325 RepID=UPI0018A2624A|nr:hypothetical protein [Pseudomonas sp. N040]MBF7729041.1 hypothetical protein [Pseudomonas sp. N040]MBW7012681.1 hypothetical protein [Pseudomonas sp. N040]
MTPILQAHTHVHLSTGPSELVASFVPDGMNAWYERSNQLRGNTPDAAARTLAILPLADNQVFTGTLGLAFCNPLSDGIKALNPLEAADGSNLHQPGIYTQRLVISSREDH